MSNHLNDLTKVYLENVLLDEKKKEKKLDPVGQEDGDIDNDGDEDDSDEYLHAKRKAIGKAMGKKDKQKKEKVEEGKNVHGRIEVPGKEPLEKQVKKAVSNVDTDIDGDTDHNDKSSGNYGEFVPSVDGKSKVTAGPAKAPKVKKEEVYSWRDSISEFVDTPRNPNNKPMTSDKSREKVVEKKVSNTIKINPVLKDVKENANEVTLVEEYVVEADDVDTIADFVFEELVEEGFDPIEIAAGLIEAKVTFGHDTKEPVNKEGPKRVAKSMARIVRRKLKRKVGQKSAEMQVAAYNKGREIMRGAKDKARVAKQKLKRGIKKAALKVADKMSEETVDERWVGKHGQFDKEYARSRSQGGKMISGDDKMSGAEYTHGRRVKAANPGMQPDVGGKTKPKSQGKMDKGTRADLQFRKAALKKASMKKEEVEQLAANLQEKAQQCWDTHKKVGMKMKGGKLVNDCRPK